MSEFARGNIVRYSAQPAGVARLAFPCCGGWSAEDCTGASIVVTEAPPYPMHFAEGEDCLLFDRVRGLSPMRQCDDEVQEVLDAV